MYSKPFSRRARKSSMPIGMGRIMVRASVAQPRERVKFGILALKRVARKPRFLSDQSRLVVHYALLHMCGNPIHAWSNDSGVACGGVRSSISRASRRMESPVGCRSCHPGCFVIGLPGEWDGWRLASRAGVDRDAGHGFANRDVVSPLGRRHFAQTDVARMEQLPWNVESSLADTPFFARIID
jgi:hypothetical protein